MTPFRRSIQLAAPAKIGVKHGTRPGIIIALIAALAAAPAIASASAQLGAPSADEGAPIVIGRSHVLRSTILKDERRIAVYLPQHYSDPSRRFPVIYLLDGGAEEDFHHITGLANISAAYGLTREVIVVGIEGRDRRHDLTAPSSDPADLKVAPTSGGSDPYRRFLVDELKPWVEGRYRTDGHSALMGESLAGLFVVETALRMPQAFDDYIAISPSMWWNREALSREAELDLRSGDFRGRRLWLAAGDEGNYHLEMKEGTDRLVASLRRVDRPGLTWSYTPMPSETHATIYHPAAMAAIRKLYAAPPASR